MEAETYLEKISKQENSLIGIGKLVWESMSEYSSFSDRALNLIPNIISYREILSNSKNLMEVLEGHKQEFTKSKRFKGKFSRPLYRNMRELLRERFP